MTALQYVDFELQISRHDGGYVAKVVDSPAGEAAHPFELPFSQDEIELVIATIGQRSRGTRNHHDASKLEAAQSFGARLFGAVMDGEVLVRLRGSMQQTGPEHGLRVKLRLQDVPELADLPWEFLYDENNQRFLAQSVQTPLVRYLELPSEVRTAALTLPLRILVMISSPKDLSPLDVEREKQLFEQAFGPLRQRGKVSVTYLTDATLRTLQRELRVQRYHVLHFIGHGGFDPRTEKGGLYLEKDDGNSLLTQAQRLGTLLRDHPSIRLAVLNACEGARNARTDPFAGVATTLVQQGIPAVIAMQFAITDDAAIRFTEEFYRALVEGLPVDAALAETRKAIYLMPNDLEWATPVLYMHAPDGVLFNTHGDARGPTDTEAPAKSAAYPDDVGRDTGDPRPATEELARTPPAGRIETTEGASTLDDEDSRLEFAALPDPLREPRSPTNPRDRSGDDMEIYESTFRRTRPWWSTALMSAALLALGAVLATYAPSWFARRASDETDPRAAMVQFDVHLMSDQDASTGPPEWDAGTGQPSILGPKRVSEDRTWLVFNPTQYEETLLCKLPRGFPVEVIGEGNDRPFNRVENNANRWVRVRLADGCPGNPQRGRIGWIQRPNLTERSDPALETPRGR